MIYIERYTGEKFLGAMDLPEFFEIDYLKEFFTDHFKLGDDFLNLIKWYVLVMIKNIMVLLKMMKK